MQNELKPCPFCGGESVMQNGTAKEEYKVCCSNPLCVGSYMYKWHPTKEAATEAWNRRATDEQAD